MKGKITSRERITMGSYSMMSLAVMINMMYVNTFATEVLKIPAATLANVLLLAKAVDLCVSVGAGAIIEKVKLGAKGKYQGWLYYFRWVMVVVCLAEVFNTSGVPIVARVAVLAVSYTILNSTLNLVQTAYYGVISVFSGSDMGIRNEITVSFTRQSTIVTLISAFIPMLVSRMPFGDWNYFIIAVIFVIPMPVALGRMARMIEGEAPAGTGVSPVSLRDMINTLLHNPQLMVVFLSQLALYIGMYTYISIYSYYFIVVVGDFSIMTVASLIAAVVGVLAAMIMPKIGIKMGKKWASACGFFIFGLGLMGIYFTGSYGWVYYAIFMSVAICGTQLYTPFHLIMYLDCGEWYMWKTGKDTRTIANGLQTPPIKIGILLGSSLGLYLLSATGYMSGMVADELWVHQFMFSCWFIPAIIYFVAGLILVLFYKITDEDAAMYARENKDHIAKKSICE
ncbi:MAG: MFS transporter [Oscillospiraceae bacterium]|nr:MFS transporter [Oscillospiraceae bacterium]